MENNHKNNTVWILGLVVVLVLGVLIGMNLGNGKISNVAAEQQGAVIKSNISVDPADSIDASAQAKFQNSDWIINYSSTDSSPSGLYNAGTHADTVYSFTKKTSAPLLLMELAFSVIGCNGIYSIEIKDSLGNLIATKPCSNNTVVFSGLSYSVGSSTENLTVSINYGSVGPGAVSTGLKTRIALNSVFYMDQVSGFSNTAVLPTPIYSNKFYLVKKQPQLAYSVLPSSLLSSGTNTIAKININSQGGYNVWKSISFNVVRSMNGFDTLSNVQLYDASSLTFIPGTATFTGGVEQDNGTHGTITFQANNEQYVGSKNYELRAVITGNMVTGDYLTTKLVNSPSFLQVNTYNKIKTNPNFMSGIIWSDGSALNHSLSTKDWFGDYYVEGTPMNSQTLQK